MNKKLLLLSLLFLAIVTSGFSQPWKQNLPQGQKSDLTLFDYQEAFNQYWAPFNLNKSGYYTNEKGLEQKARGWKQFKRWEYYWEHLVDAETGAFPDKTASDVLNAYLKQQPATKTQNTSNWVNLGTSTSEGGYAGIGRINCIAFHPTDNDTYWVGTPAGGLWATYDNGDNWEVLTDDNSVLGVSDIVIPSDFATSNTIYIGTGDRDAWDNRSIGVLKSTDGGQTWASTGLSFTVAENEMVNRLLLDPNNDNTIIAATTSGVYKTTNGGSTWNNQLTTTNFIDMEFKPGDYNTLYGSTESGSIYRTTNGGDTWSLVQNSGQRTELAVSPANAEYVYAVVAGYDNGLYGVYQSTNSGETFSQVTGSSPNLLGWDTNGGDSGGQGWYDLSIATSPTDENILLVGGVNTWRSEDGGNNWDIVNHWYGGAGAEVHADKHMLKYRDNGDLFECNDGGIYISTNDGTTWTDKTNGIVNSQMYKLGVSQLTYNEVITGLQDNGTKLYSGGSWYDVKGGDGMECLIDYTDDNIQYGTYVRGQISRTTNHWLSAIDIEPYAAGDGAWVTPYIIDPSDHNTLYAGYADVWKTTNMGDSWTKISTMNTSNKLRSMAIAESNTNVLYVADLYTIWKTTDGGDTWTDIDNGLPSNTISYIAIKDDDPNTVWVTLGGFDANSVYKTTDGGDSWTNISAGLPEIPANSIVQNKQTIEGVDLYVGTEAGVFYKHGTDNWTLFSNNLPNVKVGELEIYYDDAEPSNTRLRAATYGRGLWESPVMLEGDFPPSVSTFSATNIQSTSATLNGSILNDNDQAVTESGFVYSLNVNPEIGNAGVIKVETSPTITIGDFSVSVENLIPATNYYVRGYAINSNGTGYGEQVMFTTLCDEAGINTFPYSQDFAIEQLPMCWQNIDNNDNGLVWEFNNPGNINFQSTTYTNGFAILDSDHYGSGQSQDADLVSPVFDFTNMENIALSFEHFFRSYSGSSATLSYSIDNGATWAQLAQYSGSDEGSGSNPAMFSQDVTALVANYTEVQFKWNFVGTYGYYWCIDDVEVTADYVPSSEKEIISFTLAEQAGDALISNENGTVSIEVLNGTDVTALAPEIAIPDMATISPASQQVADFTNPVNYTVTAEDQSTKNYTVTVTELNDLLGENDIVSFDLETLTHPVTINTSTHTILGEVNEYTSLAALAPSITVSPGASLTPETGAEQDFTSTVVYTVTAQNSQTQEWEVTLTRQPSSNAFLSSISVNDEELADFEQEVLDYNFILPFGTTDLPVVDAINANDQADVSITQVTSLPGTATIEVTAENTVNTNTYTVYFEVGPNTEAEILTFSLDEIVGEANINSTESEISANLAIGTDITSLAPVISISENASVNPESGTTRDFSLPMTYIVTAEDGSKKYWGINLEVLKKKDTALAQIIIDDTVYNGFSANVFEYSITLPYETTEIPVVQANASDDDAVVTIQQATSLPGEAVITVQAEHPDYSSTTILIFNKELNDAAEILGFTLPELNESVQFNNSTATITGKLKVDTDPSALTPEIVISPDATIAPATNVATDFSQPVVYEVTAQNGTTKAWTVDLTVIPSEDASLSDILLDGESLDGFKSNTFDYQAILPVTAMGPPMVSSEKNHAGATEQIDQATYIPDTATITVLAQDNITSSQYRVFFSYEPNYRVTFKVTDSNGGVEGANVQLGTINASTNTEGQVQFEKILPAGNIYYAISKSNYQSAEGYIDVVDKDVLVEELLQPTGTPEITEGKLDIYPNPSAGAFHVKLPQNSKNVKANVIDQFGRKVKEMQPGQDEFEVDLSEFSSGIYTLEVIVGDNKILKRLIKK